MTYGSDDGKYYPKKLLRQGTKRGTIFNSFLILSGHVASISVREVEHWHLPRFSDESHNPIGFLVDWL
jgi:hypothetical protein